MELQLIQWLKENLPSHPRLKVGLGDDAAVLSLADKSECVVTTDLLAEGTHFRLSEAPAERVGHKALAANLSDLAAMAAEPLAAVISLALPRHGGLALAKQLYQGMLPLAESQSLILAGGDTNAWDGPLVISITALGTVGPRGSLLRSGARPGDRLIVTGYLGGSMLGRHLDVEPRVAEALYLQNNYALHAGIDLSDGLALDLHRVLSESKCGAVVYADAVPISDAARSMARQEAAEHPQQQITAAQHAAAQHAAALEHALHDGEDFELALAVPAESAERLLRDQPLDVPLTDVGEFVAASGMWLMDVNGQREPLAARGFEHNFD